MGPAIASKTRGTVKEHTTVWMDTPVLCDETEEVYVSKLARFARDFEASRHLENWRIYCTFPWLHATLPFLDDLREF